MPSNPTSLTPDHVLSIRRDYANGVASMSALGERHGISKQAVYNVIRRKTYAYVTDAIDIPDGLTMLRRRSAKANYVPWKERSLEVLFDARYSVKESGCWEWHGSRSGAGYGRFTYAPLRLKVYAHRWAYERWVGPIPDGLTIDHLCRNPRCVNPEHLEAVTLAENARRAMNHRYASG